MKRERERKLIERAAQKRERRARRAEKKPAAEGDNVATYADLEGYGIAGAPGGDTRRR
jgi:hypothetical protein